MELTRADVEDAHKLISSKVVCTPVITLPELSSIASKSYDVAAELFLKCENLQYTGSFKIRGATHSLLKSADECCRHGVIAASSGSHAKALCTAARDLSESLGATIPVHIVMPRATPSGKVAAVRALGAQVYFSGNSSSELTAMTQQVRKETGARLVPSGNSIDTILGQGTIGLELGELDMVIAPCGSGGLLAGLGIALRDSHTRVFGAEPAEDNADDGARGLREGKRIEHVEHNEGSTTIADGLLLSISPLPWEYISDKRYVEGIYTATDRDIKRAMKLFVQTTGMVIEPSAAVGLAVVLYDEDFKKHAYAGKKGEKIRIGAIITGSNRHRSLSTPPIDMDPLSITAAVVALYQAVALVASGIRTLASLHEAPGEFLDLQNELNTVRGYLLLAQDVLRTLAAPSESSVLPDLGNLRYIVASLESKMNRLHVETQRALKTPNRSGRDGASSETVSSMKWASIKPKLMQLRDQIYNQRVALADVLAAVQQSQSFAQGMLILDVCQATETQSQDVGRKIDDAAASIEDLKSSMDVIKDMIQSIGVTSSSSHSDPLASNAETSRAGIDSVERAKTTQGSFSNEGVSSRDLQISLNKIQSSLSDLAGRVGMVEESTVVGLTSASATLESIFLRLDKMQGGVTAAPDGDVTQAETNVRRVVSLPGVRPNGEPSSSKDRIPDTTGNLELKVAVRWRCATTCKCQCHKFTYKQSPGYATQVVGRLFLAYNTAPVFHRRPCDHPGCRNQSMRSAQLRYSFPTWLLRRALYMSLSCDSLTGAGASLHLRVPRIIPESHNVWAAIRDSDLARLQSLMSRKDAFPTDIDKHGVSLLLRAVYRRQWAITDFLVDVDPDVTRKNNLGQSPASQAVFLLNMGVQTRFPEASAALQKIQGLGDPEEYGLSIIHEALLGRRNISIEQAIELDPSAVNSRDICGFPPLHWAIFKNDVDAVQALLAGGASTETRDFEHRTALHWAAFYGYLDCATMLVAAGSIVSAADSYGKTPLHIAVREMKADLVRLLISHGANVNARDKDGWTVAHQPVFATLAQEASLEDFENIYALLSDGGADMQNVQNPERKTPLAMAKKVGMTRMAEALVRNGCAG
ncbi:tryptophan synthase beta subunit-like PLP-dependent enzyme [Immersiella caudata]|uniref:Tryptophan synthase beta subunit-like PLP-dependent enzyme n=1 Tax=Immersiella caudata TaxID=314043 RepID=A0AA39WS95_9PEZI|nr:tryptophan synthase beta subunit-like PLP-dependent enzyme [Immersiella caudata]